MEIVKQSKTVKATWLGRKGESYCLQFFKSNTGLRINVHTWTDTGEIEVKLIKGNGRLVNFREYKRVACTASELETTINELKQLAGTLKGGK